MKIPEKVRIGDKEFKIIEKKKIGWMDEDSGKIDFFNNRIKIKKSLDIRYKEGVLFHEIVHGILRELGFNYPKIVKFGNDESFVTELGLLLRKVFLDLKGGENE